MSRCSNLIVFALAVFSGTARAESPFSKISAGHWVHNPSGIVLPDRVAKFQRTGWKVFGSGGRDVGAEYDLDLLIRGDVYVYPVGTYGKDLSSEFRVQQTAVRTLNKQVKLVSEDKVSLQQGSRTIGGLHADYQLTRPFAGRSRRCGSQLYVFQYSSWFVAYRFSYPRENSEVAKTHVGEFLRQWQWHAR